MIGFRAVTNVRRPLADVVRRLGACAPPDLSDAMNGSYTMDPAIRPLYPFEGRVAGPAVTVSVPQGSFNIITFAMEQTRPGDVLVISAHGITSFAVWGGHVSQGMKRRGIAGVIIDGAARDPDEAQAIQFPVFARAQATSGPPREGPGEVNLPVACGGTVVRPGDIVVADLNGIAVVPQDAAEWVLQQASALHDRHQKQQPALERGEVTNIAGTIEALRRRGFSIDGAADNAADDR